MYTYIPGYLSRLQHGAQAAALVVRSPRLIESPMATFWLLRLAAPEPRSVLGGAGRSKEEAVNQH